MGSVQWEGGLRKCRCADSKHSYDIIIDKQHYTGQLVVAPDVCSAVLRMTQVS